MPTNFQCESGLQHFAFAVKQGLVASGTATFPGIDVRDCIGDIKIILFSNTPVADGSTGLQGSFLHGSDNSNFVTWADAPTFSLITATQATQTVILDTRKCSRYVQYKHVITGTTATFTHAVVGVGRTQSA